MTIDEVIQIIKSGEEMDLADMRLAFTVVFGRKPARGYLIKDMLEAVTERLHCDHPEQFDSLNHDSHELPKTAFCDNQRLWDLLRFCRHKLFDENLISPEEFALLVTDHPAVERLHGYDGVRAELQRVYDANATNARLYREADAHLNAATEEIARLQQGVNDLQSGMFINCVYCGHRYGPDPGTPVAMADVLKAHVEQCPKHPMSALRKRLEYVIEQLEGLGYKVDGDMVVPR